MALVGDGLTNRAIGRETGLSRATVRKYLRAAACPVRAPRAGRLAPGSQWAQLLRERWDAGCQNAARLWQDLQVAGFPGSPGLVRRHIGGWRMVPGRRAPPPAGATARPAPAPVPSPRQVKWWLLGAPDNLTEEQRTYVRRLAAAVPLIATAQQLAQAFGRLVRMRDHAALSGWLQQAEESGVAELRAVAVGWICCAVVSAAVPNRATAAEG